MQRTLKFVSVLIIAQFIFAMQLAYGQVEKFQAAYIYNFTNYVEWPESYKSGNFVIGILGSGEGVTNELTTIAQKKKAVNQPIEVVEVHPGSNISKCHILFIPESQGKSAKAAIQKAAQYNTLFITMHDEGINVGAAINFILSSGKLRFELRPDNAKSQGLKINPALQKLASKVL